MSKLLKIVINNDTLNSYYKSQPPPPHPKYTEQATQLHKVSSFIREKMLENIFLRILIWHCFVFVWLITFISY